MLKNSGKELVSYFRLSPESVLIYAIINIASIKTRFSLIIDIRNIMWVNDKYIKKNQQPETIIPIGAPNDDENRGVRLCKQVLLFVTQILTYLLTDLVNCCYSVFRFCLHPWGRNYPFISKDMFCNLRRFRVLGRKSFIRVFNCLAS